MSRRQRPTMKTRALYDLLTDHEITDGLRVVFRCGLIYTVGSGWTTFTGRDVTSDEAHAILRIVWHAHRQHM